MHDTAKSPPWSLFVCIERVGRLDLEYPTYRDLLGVSEKIFRKDEAQGTWDFWKATNERQRLSSPLFSRKQIHLCNQIIEVSRRVTVSLPALHVVMDRETSRHGWIGSAMLKINGIECLT